ncbi:ubiquitin-conjugating enzyme E2 U isoform X2 [Lithobates pipiens]
MESTAHADHQQLESPTRSRGASSRHGRGSSRTSSRRSHRSRSRSSSRQRHGRSHHGHLRHSRSDHRRSPSSHHSHHARPAANACWICGAPALPEKLACRSCFNEATKEKEADARIATDLIRESVRESILATAPAMEVTVPSTSTAHPYHSQASESSSDNDGQEMSAGFDFSLVEPFARSVKEAIGWEDIISEPQKTRKYFPNLKRQPESFPFIEELGDLIKDKWESDKRPSIANRLAKMYPMDESKVKPLVNAPIVDSSLMRLARHVTLPIEDAVSFKDVLDRKMDLELKKAYSMAGGSCRPAITTAAVARAISGWATKLEKDLLEGTEMEKLVSSLQEIRLAGDFVAEASVDIIRSSARTMLASVTARRALWLKPWMADTASKINWCKIPYDGSNLFGAKLDSAISKVTGGKSGLIPSDRRPKAQKGPSFRRSLPDKYRESRSYRPGREFRRDWKNTKPSFLRMQKTKATPAGEHPKSF